MHKHSEQNELDNPFWQFSTHIYQQPEIAQLLLKLQDDFLLNINIILLMLWLGKNHIEISPSQLENYIESINDIEINVTQPLRKLRKSLKFQTKIPPIYYEKFKDLEISLEQQIIAILYAMNFSQPSNNPTYLCAKENLALYFLSMNEPNLISTINMLLFQSYLDEKL